MTLSVLVYTMMACTLTALIGVLVVDAFRGLWRWPTAMHDRGPARHTGRPCQRRRIQVRPSRINRSGGLRATKTKPVVSRFTRR